MSNVAVEKHTLDVLATAISNKSGVPVTMTLAEMVDAVDGIQIGGDQHGTIWQDGEGYVHLDDESGIALQSKTATPTESQQVIEADEGYYALDTVTVGAISSSYVGSGVSRRSSSDLTVSGATVTAPAGYYSAQATKSVATGTAGTPTATKGTVSNHAVTVTPSVTNTTGYISGGTKTGTGVSVSASELVSGTKSITENGTGIDVTNYASVDIAVSSVLEVRMTVSGSDPNITLTPNKTFAEAKSVLDAGGELRILDSNGNALECTYQYYPSTNPPKIFLSYYRINLNLDGHSYVYYYNWTSTGVAYIANSITYDTTSADAVPSDVASGKVFYNSQGEQTGTATASSTYTPLGSATIQVNTTATTSTVIGTLQMTPSWTSNSMIFVRIRDTAGRRDGYFYGSDSIMFNSVPGNSLTSTEVYAFGGNTYRYESGMLFSSVALYRGSASAPNGYGVYPTRWYSDGRIQISARYNSSDTKTINGTFKVEVYSLSWPDGKSPFQD